MKIAILISGEYRKFDICRKTMHFLNDPNVDIYISTWDKTVYSNPKINLYIEEIVTEEKIIEDLGRNATIKIDRHTYVTQKKYNSKMIDRWITGFKLVKDSNIQYDYVIVMRPDLFFQSHNIIDLNNLEKYKDGIGFVWATSLPLKKLPDVLFASSYKNIEKLFNSLSVEIWNKDREADWHVWWYSYIEKLFHQIINAEDFAHLTFCRYWVTDKSTYLDAIDIHHDWRDLRLLHEYDIWGEGHAKKSWPDEIIDTAKEKWNSGYFDKYKSNNL